MKHHVPVCAIALLFLALAGCAGSPKERFYTLGAANPPENAQANAAYALAVGPVTVPAIVDRPQMVLRTEAGRVMLAEQARWAEPLKDNITRVIADDLARLLPDARVSAYPQDMSRHADYRVLVDVQRFESMQGDAAVIDMLWTIRDAGSDSLKTGRSLVRESAGGDGYDALVAAHERALAAVSRDIAAAVREVVSSR